MTVAERPRAEASHAEHPESGLRLTVRDLQKAYGPTRALAGVTLDISGGEFLGVAGPNGAGKSTLVRMISGEEEPDSGEMVLGGVPWSPARTEARVPVVHQEAMLFPDLTVAENLLVGRRGNGLARRPVPGPVHYDILRSLGITHDADRELGECSLVVRQFTEIARALAHAVDAQIFLFDEPNSALTEEESAELFSQMRALSDAGNIVILVSHRLNELAHVADRVIVVRDGRVGADLAGEALSEERLAREMVMGEAVQAPGSVSRRSRAGGPGDEPALTVRGWRHDGGSFQVGELTVRVREIVAVVGVEGSGGRELVRSLAGLEEVTGESSLPRGASQSTSYLPADRGESLFGDFDVGRSLVARLGRGRIAGAGGLLKRRTMARLGERYRQEFRVRAASVAQPIGDLSGGNQQKVAIASALAERPDVLLLEEPTRGVDVGSKVEIYRILRTFLDHGGAIVAYCTEIPEVFELADRAVVMAHGRITGELDVADHGDIGSLAEAVAGMSGGAARAPGGTAATDAPRGRA